MRRAGSPNDIVFSVINVTSLHVNSRPVLNLDTDFGFISEHAANEVQRATLKAGFRNSHKQFFLGPCDPEVVQHVAGVGAYAAKGRRILDLTPNTNALQKALKLGRAISVCASLADDDAVLIFAIYGYMICVCTFHIF